MKQTMPTVIRTESDFRRVIFSVITPNDLPNYRLIWELMTEEQRDIFAEGFTVRLRRIGYEVDEEFDNG